MKTDRRKFLADKFDLLLQAMYHWEVKVTPCQGVPSLSRKAIVKNITPSDASQIAFYLSNNFTEPEVLIDATKATFLISKNIPSPMGAFLSAFKNKADAEKAQSENDGTLYTWEELLEHLKD